MSLLQWHNSFKEPVRIISLVPSLTEYLWALGLEQEVVGITKFCIHPTTWRKQKTRVGGTKKVDFQVIRSLDPTLIIANKEENTKEDIEQLQQHYEVLITDISSLDEAFFYLQEIGKKVNRAAEAVTLLDEIQTAYHRAANLFQGATFLYFIWRDPYFVVGPNTYIHALLTHFGLVNSCEIARYPNLSAVFEPGTEKRLSPDYIFLSSEPFPFQAAHIAEIQALFPEAKIKLVDGEICSWYGVRMQKVPSYLESLMAKNQIG